jgi:hypothetical protein
MQTSKSLLAILSLTSLALAGDLILQNNCDFSVLAEGAKNSDPISYGAWETVESGYNWTSPYSAANDGVGVVLKVTISDTSTPYQLEAAISGGTNWYDLSALDGNPFSEYVRTAVVAGTSCMYPPFIPGILETIKWFQCYGSLTLHAQVRSHAPLGRLLASILTSQHATRKTIFS